MSDGLRPTLWRTCRVIASETRLRLLWLLFQNDGLCVADLAHRSGISEQNACNQLRALSARGLITPHRKKLNVFYRPDPNPEVADAETLLVALHGCCAAKMPFPTVIRQATAFTHARRIEIACALNGRPASFGALLEQTGISAAALSLHLSKLKDRGFVKLSGGKYRLRTPSNSFGRVLQKIVRSYPVPEKRRVEK
ncbi:MAG: ArsR family transcriptional regulator [Kiritimatiellales bacterium]